MTYKPINCGLYDELELLSLRKEKVLIKFYDENSLIVNYESVIADLFTENKVEFLKLANGKIIRLDKLIEVNGKQFGGSCNI